MILDSLTNALLYAQISPRLAEGFRFLRSADLKTLAPGKIEIAGPSVFAIIQDYTTKRPEEGFWEAHRRHIDIQYVVSGAERIGHAPIDRLRVTEPYSEEKDLIKFDGSGDVITVQEGHFTVFFPHDGHMPGLQVAGPAAVRKVVVKVAV